MKTQKDILNWNNAYTHTKTHTKVDVRPSKKNDVRFCYFLIGCVENQKQKKMTLKFLLLPWWSISLDFSIRIFAIRLIVWLWSSLMYLSKKVIVNWLRLDSRIHQYYYYILHYYYVLIAQKNVNKQDAQFKCECTLAATGYIAYIKF